MNTIRSQLHRNAVALISLFVALSSLAYNTWRNETTEAQRNTRHAAFRVLETLGELQELTDYRFYYLPFERARSIEGETRIRGFGEVAMIRDLTSLMPGDASAAGGRLDEAWSQSVNALDDLTQGGEHTAEAVAAERRMAGAIERTREAVLNVLAELD